MPGEPRAPCGFDPIEETWARDASACEEQASMRDAQGRCRACQGTGAIPGPRGPFVRCPTCKGLGTVTP